MVNANHVSNNWPLTGKHCNICMFSTIARALSLVGPLGPLVAGTTVCAYKLRTNGENLNLDTYNSDNVSQ